MEQTNDLRALWVGLLIIEFRENSCESLAVQDLDITPINTDLCMVTSDHGQVGIYKRNGLRLEFELFDVEESELIFAEYASVEK